MRLYGPLQGESDREFTASGLWVTSLVCIREHASAYIFVYRIEGKVVLVLT
jgi:hypothetical protein